MQTPIILSEKTIGLGKYLHLKWLTLSHPSGETSTYEMIERNQERVFGIVSILPITIDNEIVLIRQYRTPLDRIVLEFPAGCAEIWKHTTLDDAVHAELREETGYISDNLTHIAEFSSSSGMTNETVHGYVARNCQKVSDILELDPDEYIERLLVPYSEFDRLISDEIRKGAIIEPKMIAMMYLYKNMYQK